MTDHRLTVTMLVELVGPTILKRRELRALAVDLGAVLKRRSRLADGRIMSNVLHMSVETLRQVREKATGRQGAWRCVHPATGEVRSVTLYGLAERLREKGWEVEEIGLT